MFFTKYVRVCVCAFAMTATALVPSTGLAADQNAQRGTQLSGQWQNQTAVMTRGADGTVIYLYGETQPSVVCSPLQLCEIALQAGEAVRDVLVGDTVRWQVEPASSGSPEGARIHLIVKPAEAGLSTSMVVTTSRRTYHIDLRSQQTGYMARVAFSYREDIGQQIAAVNRQIESSIIPGAGVPAENLNFNFSMSGNARWKPARIYTDGMKTYIQFPSHLGSGDAPILFVQSGTQQQIVNYRLNNNMMIVDTLIDRAVLVNGIGNNQQRITIERRG